MLSRLALVEQVEREEPVIGNSLPNRYPEQSHRLPRDMKRHTTLPPAKRKPQQLTHPLPPPGDPSPAARARSNPGAFSELAASIANAPTLDHIVGMEPTQPHVLHAQPKWMLRKPHDRFHAPSRALIRSTMARERLRDLASHWCERSEVLRHPMARNAMQRLIELVSMPASKGIPVQDIREVLNTLSAVLDRDSPGIQTQAPVPLETSVGNDPPMDRLPDLSAIASEYLDSEDPQEGEDLRGLARTLQGALINPKSQLDLGRFDAEVVDEFEEVEGMEIFLHARVPMKPPLEKLLLSSGLDMLPAFLRQIPTLNVLVVPDYDSASIDLTGMPALHTVYFSGEVPELQTVFIPQGQTIRVMDDEGHEITLTSTPGDAAPANDNAEGSHPTAAATVADDTNPIDR